MRIVAWNIRAGGGRRADGIVNQLYNWAPDVVALSEFRGTEPSQAIAKALGDTGLCFKRTTADPHHPAKNALLVASKWPLRTVRLRHAPCDAYRWLHVNVAAPRRFALLAVHVPNRISGRKFQFLDAVAAVAKKWRGGPALILGDTNSGRIEVDEESCAFNKAEDQWMMQMGGLGWPDAFRLLHAQRREFTWYSPNGNNGFRLDQAFVQRHIAEQLASVAHVWGGENPQRRDSLSDHAALILDIHEP